MIKKNLKRIVALFLAVLMSCSVFISTGFSASASSSTVYVTPFPRKNGTHYSDAHWGRGKNYYFLNGWKMESQTDRSFALHSLDARKGPIAYCIEPGTPQSTGDTLSSTGENLLDKYAPYNKTIGKDQLKVLLGRILDVGYNGDVDPNWSLDNASDRDKLAWAIATQLHVWEAVVGERDEKYNWVDPRTKGATNYIYQLMPDDPKIESEIIAHYNSMSSAIRSSFWASSFPNVKVTSEFTWNETKQQYEATMYDYNQVLQQYTVSSPTSGVSVSTNGYNTIYVTSKTKAAHKVRLNFDKKNAVRHAVVCWSDGNVASYASGSVQDVITRSTATVSDPRSSYKDFNVVPDEENPILELVKTSEDGNVKDITFKISGNGVNITRKTDEYGEITISDLQPGTYTVTETTPSYYETQESKKVTLTAGKRTIVEFHNVLKRGDLEVTKTSDDGFVEDVTFELRGTSTSGTSINLTAKTNSDGVAIFKDVLIGSYTLREVNTGVQYKTPSTLNVSVAWDTVTNVPFHNSLKQFKVKAKKVDAENTFPLGDATLVGATYEFHREYEGSDTVIGTYKTDSKASFTTDAVSVAGDYYLVEIDPSTGYLKNDTKFYVFDDDNTDVYYNWEDGHIVNTFLDGSDLLLPETLIKAPIVIHKYYKGESADDSSLKDEKGAEFQIYLKSAGSYDAASDAERDIITTDENGYAKTKDLPYGTYVIHQTKTSNNKIALADDIEVMITKDANDASYDEDTDSTYAIVNLSPEAVIEVTKTDEETGKAVKVAGAMFRIYRADEDGNFVQDDVHLESHDSITDFATDVNGKLVTPMTLVAGKYFLVETQAPEGYKLDPTPVEFEITTENYKTATINGKTVKIYYVSKSDAPQKGRIAVYKQGEIFKTVENENAPIFEISYLPNAEFKVVANKDIVTPDGTVRVKKGTTVATLKTDENGKAVTDYLYIGEYAVIETKAPAGYVLDTTPVIVNVEYDAERAANELDLNDTNAFVQDARQRLEYRLTKTLESDPKIKTGDIDFTVFVFGLFAGEDLIAADGSVIPEGTILEVKNLDENGHLTFTTDVPYGHKYYVQEIQNDVHYAPSFDHYSADFFTDDGSEDTLVLTQTIFNILKRGKIVGHKYGEVDNSEDRVPVAGAVFGLFYEDCTEFTEENAVMLATSDENGEFVFDSVGYGTHLIRELSAPESYLVNEEVFEFVMVDDNQTQEFDVYEELIRGDIAVLKVDEEYPDHTLSGAAFDIYKDVNENGEYDVDVDVLYGTLTEGENGVYSITDVAYGHYFVKETVAPAGFALDENYYPVFVEEDGMVYNVENNGECFINKPLLGGLHLVKTSSDKNVEGFTFNISGMSDSGIEINVDVVTDANGNIDVTNLRTGTYTITEVANDMTERYVLPASQEIVIKDNETTEVSFYNKVIQGTIVITKTDVVTGEVVPGALIEIIDKDGNVIASGRTDKNGEVSFLLDYGTYYFKESEAPEGYILDETPHEFTISEDGQIIKAEMTNKAEAAVPQTGSEMATILMAVGGLTAILGGLVFIYSRRRKTLNANNN